MYINNMKRPRSIFCFDVRNLLFQAFVPLADVTKSTKLNDIYSSNDLGTYINRLFFFAITIGAIIAVVRLMWAGYVYMAGARDNWSSISHAKDIMFNVTVGLLLLLGMYLILFQINPDMLKFDFLTRLRSSAAPLQQSQAPGGGTANPNNANGGN